ncbi:MAG: hypothetical protein KDD43_06960 [Bdellovibrionales bacterium]|nr:hypothetical protein [Bdellovibrionales bacterium]
MQRIVVILAITFVLIWTARWWGSSSPVVIKARPDLPELSRKIETIKDVHGTKGESARKPGSQSHPAKPDPKMGNQKGLPSALNDAEKIRQYLRTTLSQLEDFGRESIPNGRMTYDQTNDLGFRSTIEETSMGDTISRTFDANGFVMGEKWKKGTGEELVRTFRDDGRLEGVYLQRKDGTSSSVSWSPDGHLYSKKDDLGNGDMIYTLYDSSGFESQIWRKTKDGRSLRLDE